MEEQGREHEHCRGAHELQHTRTPNQGRSRPRRTEPEMTYMVVEPRGQRGGRRPMYYDATGPRP
jgi:hypothetical protein